MRLPSVARLGLVSAVLAITAVVLAPLPFRLEANTAIAPEEAGRILVALRQAGDADRELAWPESLAHVAEDPLPLVLTLWKRGRREQVWQVDGKPLADAAKELAGKLRNARRDLADPSTRLQLDLATASGWVPHGGPLFALSFVEGHDGVSAEVDGRRVYLSPSELIRLQKYGSFRPLPAFDAKFRIGLDRGRVMPSLGHAAERAFGKRGEAAALTRFRALTVVEGSDLSPRRLLKASTDRPALTRGRGEAVVLAGAGYLARALRPDGMYRYYWDPVADKDLPGVYNWPRHAGVSYSLALAGRLLERPELLEAAGRALERFEKELVPGPSGSRCLMAQGKCYVGSAALGLLALSEYRLATGDARFDESARAVARFLRFMQKPDGFHHDWYPDKGIDRELMKLYATQQAILALAIHARAVGGDAESLAAAEAGMDYLAGPYWDHFLGHWHFLQEHWTCLAAEELYAARPKPEYARICHEVGRHYDRITLGIDETPFAEDAGGMSVTHIFTPHVGGTATAAEAMVSAAILGRAIGKDVSSIEEQLRQTFHFLARGQVSAHDRFWIRRPRDAVGGFYESQTKTRLRIDTVQHAISAIVR
ncbi:MAG TPA: hypothetical protein VM285_10205, partial [Polyangia bacterium]|nr:hypothetical protein [Polyangia bacterium]